MQLPEENHIERTFVMIKPEGLRRRLLGNIITRFENRELTLRAIKLVQASRKLAETHYRSHRNQPYFDELVDLMVSGPVIAMVWEGEHAIKLCRLMTGSVKPLEAEPGTIRGDYASSALNSIIHVSDSPARALEEIDLWFPDGIGSLSVIQQIGFH
jgi:nucleoside-diphosphate kinase